MKKDKEMGLFKQLFRSFTRRNQFEDNHKNLKDNFNMTWNIVKSNVTKKEYSKQFKAVHVKFKYKLIVPLLIIGRKLLGKYLLKHVENKNYNRIIKAFDEEFENTLAEWTYIRDRLVLYSKKTTPEQLQKKYETDVPQTMLRTMKNMLLTVIINDTAYRQFFEILLANMAIKLSTEKILDEKHILYTSKDINDKNFYTILGTNQKHFTVENKNLNQILVVPKSAGVIIEKVNNTVIKPKTPEEISKKE